MYKTEFNVVLGIILFGVFLYGSSCLLFPTIKMNPRMKYKNDQEFFPESYTDKQMNNEFNIIQDTMYLYKRMKAHPTRWWRYNPTRNGMYFCLAQCRFDKNCAGFQWNQYSGDCLGFDRHIALMDPYAHSNYTSGIRKRVKSQFI